MDTIKNNIWFILTFLLNVIVLKLLDINIFFQAQILFIICYFFIIGVFVSGRKYKAFDDLLLFVIISVIIGISVFTLINFVLFHIKNNIFIKSCNYMLIVFAGMAAFKRLKAIEYPTIIINRHIILTALLISFVISLFTSYGFLNNFEYKHLFRTHTKKFLKNESIIYYKNLFEHYTADSTTHKAIKNWGNPEDQIKHIGLFPAHIHKQKLPIAARPYGVQTFLVAINYLFGDFDIKIIVGIYKIFSFFLWFSVIYMSCYVGRKFYSLSNFGLCLVIISAGFFSSINYPVFTTQYSSYYGSLGSAGMGMYHNSTQLFGIAVGLAGIICLLYSITGNQETFLLSTLLISSSFFFKPSFFTIVAPAVFTLIPFYQQKFSLDKIFGYLMLFLIPAYWLIYPGIFHLEGTETNIIFKPFAICFIAAGKIYPQQLMEHPYILGSIIISLSYMIFFPIIINMILDIKIKSFLIITDIMPYLKKNRVNLFFLVIFFAGLLPYVLLVENNSRALHGNFGWGRQAGNLLLIPFLIYNMVNIKSRFIKGSAMVVWAFHIWGGLLHLILFTFKGMISPFDYW